MIRNFFQRVFSLGRHTHPIDKLGEANALLSGIAIYPQLFKLLVTHEVSGISATTYIIILVNSVIWCVYAIHRKTPPLLVSSTLNAIASTGVLLLLVAFQMP